MEQFIIRVDSHIDANNHPQHEDGPVKYDDRAQQQQVLHVIRSEREWCGHV